MKEKVQEIFFLRSIACLTVVLIHAFTEVNFDFTPSSYKMALSFELIQILLMYGTPMFIFISEFVISYNYKYQLPNHFILKRTKFILIPFVFMGIFYAIFWNYTKSFSEIFLQIFKNIFLVGYHGYFILIIFQFYFLHLLFNKVGKQLPFKWVIVFSLAINLIYLGFFNFIEPFGLPNAEYIWNRVSWIPFTGWIVYFVMGYYVGLHYEKFKQILIKNSKWVFLSWGITALMILLFQKFSLIDHIGSKRIDVLLFTVSTIMVFFLISIKIEHIPKLFILLSQYSFGIYLLHPFFQQITVNMLKKYMIISNPIIILLIIFITGTILPMFITYLLNKTKLGSYLVGKVGGGNEPTSSSTTLYNIKQESKGFN